ncbi:MAG: GntR family transcriptional regulator [Bacilli bacterium]|jgi:GntR family transcriptional regulator
MNESSMHYIELSSKSPIYEQLSEEYKKLILLGVFKEGEKLPSVRELGLELGINPNTVARAYEILISEGLVESYEKKGIYVIYKKDKQVLKDNVKKKIEEMKTAGIKKDELIQIVNNVYGGKNK